MQLRAPSASARNISAPVRMPPSNITSMSEPTASTILGSIAIDDDAPSSWRPPWLETTSALAPVLAASSASSMSRIPLMMSLPPHWSRIHSTSFQLSRGSNCSLVHCASDLMPSMPCTWPARLPKVLRLPLRIESAQAGLVAMSMTIGDGDRAAARSCRSGCRDDAGRAPGGRRSAPARCTSPWPRAGSIP